MKQLLFEISQATLSLVFPIYCQGCGVKLPYNCKKYLCQRCLKEIRLNNPPFCIRCGRALSGSKDIKTVCPDCLNKNYYFDEAWQCCEYDGLLKELIQNFKYNQKLYLKDILIEILENFTKNYMDYKGIDVVMPVPMHQTNVNKRGFNQSALLSKGLSKVLNTPYIGDCLLKTKKTKQQVVLNKRDRLSNIKDAFSVRRVADVRGKRILLLDDVFTTGATVDECSKVLSNAGAKSVCVLTLARGV